MIEDLQKVLVTANLTVAGWVIDVWLLRQNLLEHGVEQHVDTSVAFDELFELLQHRVKVLRVLVNMVDYATEPFSVHKMITGQPVSNSSRSRQRVLDLNVKGMISHLWMWCSFGMFSSRSP